MVRVTSAPPHTSAMAVISVIREFSGCDLATAKAFWDQVAGGETIVFPVRHPMDIVCANRLNRLGVAAEATNQDEILREMHERPFVEFAAEVYWLVLEEELERQIRAWSDSVEEMRRLWPDDDPGSVGNLLRTLEAIRPFVAELSKRHSVKWLYPFVSHGGITLRTRRGDGLWCMADGDGIIHVDRMESTGDAPIKFEPLFMGSPADAAAFANLFARKLRRENGEG